MSLPPFTPSRPRDWQPNAIPPRTNLVQTSPDATLDSGALPAASPAPAAADSANPGACRGSCGQRAKGSPARD